MAKQKATGGSRKRSKPGLSVIQRQLVAGLRLVWSRYDPQKKQVKEDAKVYRPKFNKDGTQSKAYEVWYRCSKCQELYRNRSDVHVHHVTPVGECPGWPLISKDWGDWLARLFTEKENLILYCKKCHMETHHGEG